MDLHQPAPTWARAGDRVLKAAARTFHTVRSVRRPAGAGHSAFDLAYVRSGPPSKVPAVVIPGGPGLGSILPYGKLRRQAAADGLDVLMVEHRGIGLSRSDVNGRDLSQAAMWVEDVIDDIAAVLDAEGVQRTILAGSSYGSYLASSFAAKYPERVAGMLLDSALQSTADLQIERQTIRELFWDSPTEMAGMVRRLVEAGEDQRQLLDVVRAGYELVGEDLVRRMLRCRLERRPNPAWRMVASYAARDASIVGIPGYYEFGRAGAIGFRELNYGAQPDGGPLDPALTYSLLSEFFPSFLGEPYDLLTAAKNFTWPVALLVGDRDVRTPPQIARRTADLAPSAAMVQLHNGHSALDTHMLAFEKTLKALAQGKLETLPDLSPSLDLLPRRGAGASFANLLTRVSRIG